MLSPVALFDADGVFLQTSHAGNYFQVRYGLRPEQLTGFAERVDQCILGRADFCEELKPFLAAWRDARPPEEVLEEAFATGGGIDPAVAAAVQTLRDRGVTCGLVTNQDRHRMAYLDRVLAIRRHFDVTFVSCELGHKKPDAAFYRTISAHFPGRVLAFWDDRPENVTAAQACGWQAFLFRDAAALLEDFDRLQR